MTAVDWERYPLVAKSSNAKLWLQIKGNLGLAPNTIEAYGRSLEDYLSFCNRAQINPETAKKEHIALYVRDLTLRPNPHCSKLVSLDSGAGLANATMQLRITAVRLFYDHLIEEGFRLDNPVGRGRYTPGKEFGGNRDRGLIPRYTKLPWIPNNEQWRAMAGNFRGSFVGTS